MSYRKDDGSTWGGILMVIAVIAAWGLGYHMRSQGFQIDVTAPPATPTQSPVPKAK